MAPVEAWAAKKCGLTGRVCVTFGAQTCVWRNLILDEICMAVRASKPAWPAYDKTCIQHRPRPSYHYKAAVALLVRARRISIIYKSKAASSL